MNLGDFQDRRGNLLRDAIRYNWWVILICMLLGLLAGVGFAQARPAKYSSSTTLLLTQIVGNPYTNNSNSDTLEMLQTEAVAVTSQTLLEGVKEELGLDDVEVDGLRSRTRVSVPPNTQALQITYTATSRTLAPEIVDAIAEAFLDQRREVAVDAIDERDQSLDAQIAEANDELKQANLDGDKGRASAIRSTITDYLLQKADNRTQSTDPGRVLTPSKLATGSQKKHLVVFAIAGMIAGGLGGVAIGLWRERRKDVIRTASDLDDYSFDAPVTAIHGRELDEEALRHLRMRLAPQIRDHGVVSLVGIRPGQALSTGVLLGTSLSSGGTSVVLIDGTGTEPGHRDLLDYEGKPGLSDALTGATPLPVTAHSISTGFGYLPAGSEPKVAAEHLVDDRARTVIHSVAERYDLTLVATMPLENVEGEVLARLTEGVLLLVELNTTSHYELGMALKTITSQGRPLLGVFVLPAPK